MVLLPLFTALKAGAVATHVIDENTASPALSVLNLLAGVSIVISQFVYAYRREQDLRRDTEKKLADLSLRGDSRHQEQCRFHKSC